MATDPIDFAPATLTTPAAPPEINFDRVSTTFVVIRKPVDGEERVWWLKDKLPTELMIRVLRLMRNAKKRSRAAMPADEDEQLDLLIALQEEHVEETWDVFVGIWLTTYPMENLEDLRGWFAHEEREEVVQRFFTLRLLGSMTPSGATTSSTPSQQVSQSQSQTPNREQRRATRSKTGQGAMPSQKRLSRELRGR